MEPKGIIAKLLELQHDLKVEKGTYNEFGGFYFRSKEDILKAAKPLCYEARLAIKCEDEVKCMENGAIYVTTTASLIDADTGEVVSASASAREPESKPKMDSSQVSGSAASFAGKRALGNLFALDDTKDADGYDDSKQQNDKPCIGTCTDCGRQYQFESVQHMNNSMCECGNRTFEVL